MQKQRGSICPLDVSYFLWDGPNLSPFGDHLSPPGSSLKFSHSYCICSCKKDLFQHRFSSRQRPKKIKVSYKGEIKLNGSSLFSHSVVLWIKVLGYLTCRGWTSWKFQIAMGFGEKSLQLIHTEGKWQYIGTRNLLFLKIFASFLANTIFLYLSIYDEETVFIKPFRDTLKFLIHLFIITSAGLKLSLK